MKMIIYKLISALLFLSLCDFSSAEPDDEFSLGYVTTQNYPDIDWEDLRKVDKNSISRGVIDGFLSVKETSPGIYQISLYETLEAMEYDRPRKSLGISSDIFREGLSLELRNKNYTFLHKKWVKIYGVFEYYVRNTDLPLADTIKCDSVEWRNSKGELVRSL